MLKRITWSVGMFLILAAIATLVWFASSPYSIHVVTTGSMGSTIPPGSAVFVHEGEYRVGQPVTFISNGEEVTHRLVGIMPDGNIVTKGDGNESEDASHPPTSVIIGGVVAAPQHLGWWITFTQQRESQIALVAYLFSLTMFGIAFRMALTEHRSNKAGPDQTALHAATA